MSGLDSGLSYAASAALAVSGDGLTAVGYGWTGETTDTLEAFRWTDADGMVSLGFLPGRNRSMATGVSADGSVVVGYSSTENVSGSGQNFLWTSAGGMVGIGSAGDGGIRALSADGSTAVGKSLISATRWTASDGMVELGVIPGGTHSDSRGVSADGSIVVGICNNGGACFWNADWNGVVGMRSIRMELAAAGVNLAGWQLESAVGVAETVDGITVAGYGTNPGGQYEAWIAVLPLPEPRADLLLIAGAVSVVGLASWRSRA